MLGLDNDVHRLDFILQYICYYLSKGIDCFLFILIIKGLYWGQTKT